MMQCETVQNQLDDLLDGELSAAQQIPLQRHIAQCATCAELWQQAHNLTGQLRQLPAPEPRAGYEQRMLRFLQSTARPSRPLHERIGFWFGSGFATAMLALLGVWLVFSGSDPYSESMPVVTVELPALQTRNVDLVFNSPRAIQSASLRIELPEGTEIAGYPKRQYLEWQTSLKPGTNRLSLPLIIKAKNGGTLYARLRHAGQTRVFKIQLISTPASTQINSLQLS